MAKNIVLMIIALMSVLTAHAQSRSKETRVIFDAGGEPIFRNGGLENTKRSSHSGNVQFYDVGSSMFPIRTNEMEVGPVLESEANDIRFDQSIRPFFIIGYDAISKEWLTRNLAFLSEKKAMGIVVNVESIQQMDELQKIVDGRLVLQPMNGASLSKALNIKHYPFYLDRNGVMR